MCGISEKKSVYGTSHIVSPEEIKNIYETHAARIIFGAGHDGILKISQ